MAVSKGEIGIYGVLVNDTDKGIIAKSEQLFDSAIGKKQSEINKQLLDNLGGSPGTITGLTSVGKNYLKDTSIGAPYNIAVSKKVIIGENVRIKDSAFIGSYTSIDKTNLRNVNIYDTIISTNGIEIGSTFFLTNHTDGINVDFYDTSIKLTKNNKHSLVIGTCNENLLSTDITTTYITEGVYIGNIRSNIIKNISSYNVFIGSGVNILHDVTVAETVNIGSNVSIGDLVTIGSSVSIGGDVSIGNSVNISRDVNIGSNVQIADDIQIDKYYMRLSSNTLINYLSDFDSYSVNISHQGLDIRVGSTTKMFIGTYYESTLSTHIDNTYITNNVFIGSISTNIIENVSSNAIVIRPEVYISENVHIGTNIDLQLSDDETELILTIGNNKYKLTKEPY